MSFITWKPDTEIIKQTIEEGLVLNSQISSDNINMTLNQDSIFLKDLCDFLNIDNNFSYLNTSQINKDLIKNAFNSACVKIFDKRTNDIEKIEGQLYFFKDEIKLYSVYNEQWIEIPFLLNNLTNSANISTKVITTPNETINIDLNLLIERAPNTPLYVLMFGGGGNGSHYGGGGGGDFEYFTIEDTVNNPVDYLSVTVGNNQQSTICSVFFKNNTNASYVAHGGTSGSYDEATKLCKAGSGGSGGGGNGDYGWCWSSSTEKKEIHISASQGGAATYGGGGGAGGLCLWSKDLTTGNLFLNGGDSTTAKDVGQMIFGGGGGGTGGATLYTEQFEQIKQSFNKSTGGLNYLQEQSGGSNGQKGADSNQTFSLKQDLPILTNLPIGNKMVKGLGGKGSGHQKTYDNTYFNYLGYDGGGGGGAGYNCNGGDAGKWSATTISSSPVGVAWLPGGGGGGGFLAEGGKGGDGFSGGGGFLDDYAAGGGGGGGGFGAKGGNGFSAGVDSYSGKLRYYYGCGGGGGGYGVAGQGGEILNVYGNLTPAGIAAGGCGYLENLYSDEIAPHNGGPGIFILYYYLK